MRKLDKALRLSNDEWVDSLPDKLEEYQLSDDCQNKMNSMGSSEVPFVIMLL